MPIVVALIALLSASALPPCRRSQLTAGVAPRDGIADFAPVGGAMVSIRNHGPDCVLASLPIVTLLDARRRRVPAARRVPPGMHPGPAMVPLALTGGHRATFELTWPRCDGRARCVRLGGIAARFGPMVVKAQVAASIPLAPRRAFRFDQPPGRVAEGMASDLD